MSERVTITRSKIDWMIVLAAAAETAMRIERAALTGLEDAAKGERAADLLRFLDVMLAEVKGIKT